MMDEQQLERLRCSSDFGSYDIPTAIKKFNSQNKPSNPFSSTTTHFAPLFLNTSTTSPPKQKFKIHCHCPLRLLLLLLLLFNVMTRRRLLEYDHEDAAKLAAAGIFIDGDAKHVASFRRHVHRHFPDIVRRPGCYVIGCLLLLAFSTISLFVKFTLLNSFDEMRFMHNDKKTGGPSGNFIPRQKLLYQSNAALAQSASAKTNPHNPVPAKTNPHNPVPAKVKLIRILLFTF